MSALGKLVASVVLDTAEFSKGADKAQYEAARAAAAIEKHFDGLNRKVDSSFKGMAASMAAGLGVGALVAWGKHALDAADETGKLAQKAGVAIEEFSKLSYAAKLSDVSTEALQKGIKGLSETMTKAADATSKEASLMKSLGVDFKGSVSDAISQVADTFAKLPDGATKATLATTLFGKAGMDMIPFLNQGAAGIGKLKTEAEKLGLVMNNETAKAAEQFNDNMKALATSSQALGIVFANSVVPQLSEVTSHLKDAYVEGGKLHMLWVLLGAVGTAIFTDDMLSDVQKLNREIATQADTIQRMKAMGAGAEGSVAADSLAKSLAEANVALDAMKAKRDAILNAGKKEKALAEERATYEAWESEELESQLRTQLAKTNSVKEHASSLKDIDKLLNELAAKDAGQDGGFGEKANKLNLAMQTGVISLEQYTVALGQLYAQSPLVAKAMKDEADAVKHLTEMRDRLKEQELEEIDARDQVINSLEDSIDQLKIETATLGMTTDQRDLYLLGLEKERALKSAITDKDVEYINQLVGEKKALIESRAMGQSQLQIWGELSDRAGAFFGDLVMNGASAFDRLKQSLKSFAAEMVAMFAKKWILNMVGNMIGGPVGQSLTTEAAKTGGSALMTAAGPWAAVAAMSAALGNLGAKALGAGERGQKIGTIAGLLTGGLTGAIIGKFTDPDGLANRTADFGGGRSNYWHGGGSSAFGSFGVTNDKWFSDADMKAKLQEFEKALGTTENALAKFLKPDELQRAIANLTTSKQYSFGTEHGDFSGALGQILKDRIDGIVSAVDPSLKKLLEGFVGTGEELANFALDLLSVREQLSDSSMTDMLQRIPDLTIEGLMKMQAAGESLSDTFTRVVGAFLVAENNLNQAIGARNPQFARDLVLSQRNSVGVQFASSIGQSYGADLATRMALNPQSFTGLGTEQMNLLANWLTLQTTLEQLDAQLANVAGQGGSLSNFGNALDSTASQMAGARLSLAGYLNGLNQSNLSPLTPQQKYIAAGQVFNQQAALAEGGNLDALAGLSGYHQAFLTASQAVNASSGAYNADYFSSYSRLNAISGGQAQNPLTAGVYSAGVQAMGTQIIALQASVQQITTTLQTIYNGPIPVEVVNGDDVGAPIAAALDPRTAGAPLG